MKIYIAICKDRHSDTTAKPFVDPDKAIEWARSKAMEYAREVDDYSEEEVKGWLFHATYSCEGDCIYVVTEDLEFLPEIEDQSKLMHEALDKINVLGFDELDEGPRIACEVLDVVNPTNGG